MMNFTGYFLLGSKFGGLTMKPWTLSLLAPVNQKGSRGDMETWDRTESLMCVSWRGLNIALLRSGSLDSPLNIATNLASPITSSPYLTVKISAGASRDIRLKTRMSEVVTLNSVVV